MDSPNILYISLFNEKYRMKRILIINNLFYLNKFVVLIKIRT